jgi:hypothetical protein
LPEELLYIPGAWVASALALHQKALKARQEIMVEAELDNRDKLAMRLLVGMEV